MWQAATAPTSASSGSTPPGSDIGAGTTSGEDEPVTIAPPSKLIEWRRL